MVEMRGIEPLSEEASPQGATSVVCDLDSRCAVAHKQASASSSFIDAWFGQSFPNSRSPLG